MHVQPVFRIEELRNSGIQGDSRGHGARVVGGEVSEDLFNRGLCLPSGTAMTEEDLERVVSAIRKCKQYKGDYE
jgi:dTDP-4-amino-4,6-dideoxygalactose transaminase